MEPVARGLGAWAGRAWLPARTGTTGFISHEPSPSAALQWAVCAGRGAASCPGRAPGAAGPEVGQESDGHFPQDVPLSGPGCGHAAPAGRPCPLGSRARGGRPGLQVAQELLAAGRGAVLAEHGLGLPRQEVGEQGAARREDLCKTETPSEARLLRGRKATGIRALAPGWKRPAPVSRPI